MILLKMVYFQTSLKNISVAFFINHIKMLVLFDMNSKRSYFTVLCESYSRTMSAVFDMNSEKKCLLLLGVNSKNVSIVWYEI